MGRPINNFTGQRFGRLLVLRDTGKKIRKNVVWQCLCDCGASREIPGRNLVSGNTKSCGCLNKEQVKKLKFSHGLSKIKFYSIWKGMKKRTLVKSDSSYQYYGGRGIKVCERWQKFENFRDDMYEGYLAHIKEFGQKNTSIDRINNSGNYEPKNCRWATRSEQQFNKGVSNVE